MLLHYIIFKHKIHKSKFTVFTVNIIGCWCISRDEQANIRLTVVELDKSDD